MSTQDKQTVNSYTIDNDRLIQTGSVFQNSKHLDEILMSNGFSQFDNALSSSLYGIDILSSPSPAQMTNEHNGLVFFTRPMLNLSYYNLTVERSFTPMMTANNKSVAAYVRAILDPIGNSTYSSPLVDSYNPFIPLLSNTVQSLSGWRDPIVDTYQSPAGIKKEQWAMVDSSNKVYTNYELSATFRNVRGNFLYYLFHVWQTYMSLVYEGAIRPHSPFIVANTIDYQTRIYRLILNPTRTHVEEIVSCNAAFPLANPSGVRANYNQEQPVNREVDVMNQTFLAQGANYFDPYQMYEFNRTVGALNPVFANEKTRMTAYRRLWPKEYKLFTYRALPFINTQTSRLEWWVSNKMHASILGKVDYPGFNPPN